MLFFSRGVSPPYRVQGCFESYGDDHEDDEQEPLSVVTVVFLNATVKVCAEFVAGQIDLIAQCA